MNYERTLSIKADMIGEISQDVRKTAFVVLQGVTLKTPKDTGLATSSWLLGISNAPTDRPLTSVGKDQSNSEAQAKGLVIIGQYPNSALPDLWIVNNQPYIGRLNDGYSEQTPAKFVEASISEAVNRTF
jgi:hypothetical protein